ncbi:hypothetical protein BASA81_008369 [Batrachochytrium salamandrivorans]|nr:hypothetical protein BASA81_008369 [Batrachochytrium salamandrivorans]
MNSRTVLYVALGEEGETKRVLEVHADVLDEATMLWFQTSPHGPVGLFEHLKLSLVGDFEHICNKSRGVIVIPNVLQYQFQLVPSSNTSRRDHLLQFAGSTIIRPQVFPSLLRVTLYTPQHKF